MSLFEEFIGQAYDNKGQTKNAYWDVYLPKEQKIYEEYIASKGVEISGTVEELAKRFKMTNTQIVGFLEGIREAAFEDMDMKSVTESTFVSVKPDLERLYMLMVEYKAEKLYNLPQWEDVLSKERQKELFTEQKHSKTVVREEAKVGRNDPCPCGSGKKYKKCCGA